MHEHRSNLPQLLVVVIVPTVMWLDVRSSRSDEPVSAAKATAGVMRGKAPGEVRDDNSLKMELVWCPPGFLTMEQVERIERPANEPANDIFRLADPFPPFVQKMTPVKAFISRGYWLGKYEVTQAEWRRVMPRAPWEDKENTEEGDDFPASSISWLDAMSFCRKLTKLERRAGRLSEGWEYTLPTEAQWERACRARTETKFSFGDDVSKLGEFAWFRDNCDAEHAQRVGQKKPNLWGLYDMHGNMWEWCRDNYAGKLPGGRDPDVSNESSSKVIRGGGWNGRASWCSSAFRPRTNPGGWFASYGFRVALTSVQPVKPGSGTPGDRSRPN
jgi:formylglycine-generating enzyme required for sulfatase activity